MRTNTIIAQGVVGWLLTLAGQVVDDAPTVDVPLTKPKFWEPGDWAHVAIWLLGCVFLGISVFCWPSVRYAIGVVAVVAANLYLLAEQGFAANRWKPGIPHRFPAFFIVPAIFLTVLFGFAAIFIATQGVDTQQSLSHYTENGKVVWFNGYKKLTEPIEALYFSLTTFTTFGSEFSPVTGRAKFWVAAELLTALNLLLFAFPILVSRLAMFDEPLPESSKRETSAPPSKQIVLTAASKASTIFLTVDKVDRDVQVLDEKPLPNTNGYIVTLTLTPTFKIDASGLLTSEILVGAESQPPIAPNVVAPPDATPIVPESTR